jgi:hypothetical protein
MEDEDEDETEDEYCVYTYKGDQRGVADLPSSFFKFDQADSSHTSSSTNEDSGCTSSGLPLSLRLGANGLEAHSSSGTTHHHKVNGGGIVTISGNPVNGIRPPGNANGDAFSPDMDFLEMDFDPGGPGEDEDEEAGDEHSDTEDAAPSNGKKGGRSLAP